MDFSLILLNTSCEMCSIPKSKCTAVLLSINNETYCVRFFCFSSRFMTYALSFILGKLSLEEISLSLGS